MKKILANSSIKNKRLRERSDLSPLHKTAIHRYHNESIDSLGYWLSILSYEEKVQVKAWLSIDNDFWNKYFAEITEISFPSDKLVKAIELVKDSGLEISNLDTLENYIPNDNIYRRSL